MACYNWVGKRLFSPIKQTLIRYSYVCQSRGAPVRAWAALSCWFYSVSRHIHRVCLFHQMNERRSSWNHPTETMRPPQPIGRRDPCTSPLYLPLEYLKERGRAYGRDYGMAKLHEMSLGPCTSRQWVTVKSTKTHRAHRIFMLEINRYYTNKHTQTFKEKKEKGGITAISVAAERVFMSSLNKPGHSGLHSVHGTLGTIEGAQNESEFGKKVNICTQRSLPAGTDTHQGSSRLSKSSNWMNRQAVTLRDMEALLLILAWAVWVR